MAYEIDIKKCFYTAWRIEVLAKIGEPFAMEDEETAQFVWKWIKNKKKFKISKNTIWRIKP